MAETSNLGLTLLETGQSGKELVVNTNMALIDAALPAAITLPLPVEQGGTEATSLTDHGVLVGSGTDPLTALSVGATGTVLAGNTGADPAFTDTPTVTSLTLSGSSGNSLVCDTDVLIVDATNNRVGIGTATPTSKLVVFETATDPGATLSNVNTSQATTLTTNNSQVVRGFVTNISVNQAGHNHTAALGIRGADLQATASGASGTVTGAVGANFAVVNSGAGALTLAVGVRAAVANSGGGTLGTWVGFDSTATYGYRGSITAASTRWNLYMEGTAQNYLAGNLGIGVTTPTNALSFGGNAARILWMERHTTSNTAGQSLTVQSGGATSGATDKAPGALLLATGLGTGNAVPGLLRLQGDAASATSGTTDHTTIDRFIPNAFKVLTDNSAIAVVNATVADGSAVGGVIDYTIEVTDGTDYQAETGQVLYAIANKAGTVTTTISEVNTQQNLTGGSTLATTWAASAANPSVISVNANSSLTPSTGYPRITFSLKNFGQQAVAIP